MECSPRIYRGFAGFLMIVGTGYCWWTSKPIHSERFVVMWFALYLLSELAAIRDAMRERR